MCSSLSSTLLFTCAASLFAACIDTDTAVFVDPSIEAPELAVQASALGASMSGSFDLVLHLGARASGPAEVTYSSFSLKTADGASVIVESLPVTASVPSPVAVDPGGDDVIVSFTIDTGADLIPQEQLDAICAGQVLVAAVLDDSLATSSTAAQSAPFTASGCP